MNTLESTLSSPISSSGYGSAEEDHAPMIPFPGLSRRYDPVSPPSNTGSGIFSFASTSSPLLQTTEDGLLPEALGSFFGDLLEFEKVLPNLDLSGGLNLPDNVDPTHEEITDPINDDLGDHGSDPTAFDCFDDLYHYFEPDVVDYRNLDGCNYSTNIGQSSSIDFEEEAGSEGPAESPEDNLLVLCLRKTTFPVLPTHSGVAEETSITNSKKLSHFPHPANNNRSVNAQSFPDARFSVVLSNGRTTKVEECLEHSADRVGSVAGDSSVSRVEAEFRNSSRLSEVPFQLMSRGEGKPLPGQSTSAKLSIKELPQALIRFSPEVTASAATKSKQPISVGACRGDQVHSPNGVNPSSCKFAEERRRSSFPNSHNPSTPGEIRRTPGIRRPYTELDDHRYSSPASNTDPTVPPKLARTDSEVCVSGSGKSTGSTRVATGSGHRRSKKTILETFLLTTEKLNANKGSDAMLAEDSIARLYSGEPRVFPVIKSSSTPSSCSSFAFSLSSQGSSVLERLLTEGGRGKRQTCSNRAEDSNSTINRSQETAKELRHAIIATPATPSVSNSLNSNCEQFESSNFTHDSVALHFGLLNEELEDYLWAPYGVDDKIFSYDMESIIGQSLNPDDALMHQYISDLL